ncbi:MAG: hypothetical protein F4213_03205 [Boseongicola sp. SB0677_bin_26]|nr:hypothetical protein [Boseongicola sp. SB0665_bin_10]MYG25022.1 hypothetical protein [Boseongicola sp. SB0677_bin_26]
MDTYSVEELYGAVVKELFVSRDKAKATGGRNNIRARGDGPEQAIRSLIGNLVGGLYRVTHGHVVRADGLKSGQMDVIVVKDVPAATMHKSDEGETELVRVEWVAAVGEVKASWWDHAEVVKSYCRVVNDMECLQKGQLVANRMRFGAMSDEVTVEETTRPITGRQWSNRCYTFLIALGQGACKVRDLEADMRASGIRPNSASVLILDEGEGATLCTPARLRENGIEIGVAAEVSLDTLDTAKAIDWATVQETGLESGVSCARLLHRFVTDLQLHLGTWYDEYINPSHYAKLGPVLTRRHAGERKLG